MNETAERCDDLRLTSDFFDLHCPVTCNLCRPPSGFVSRTTRPLAPALEGAAWLVGGWEGTIEGGGGSVAITITPAAIPLFGRPSLRFRSHPGSPLYFLSSVGPLCFAAKSGDPRKMGNYSWRKASSVSAAVETMEVTPSHCRPRPIEVAPQSAPFTHSFQNTGEEIEVFRSWKKVF